MSAQSTQTLLIETKDFRVNLTLCQTALASRLVIVLLMGVLLSACEPEATPMPVDVMIHATPEATATALAGRSETLQYVLLPNTLNAVPDLELIQSAGSVTQMTEAAEVLPEYDIAVQYGLADGWTVSDYLPTVALVIAPENPLFENEAVIDVIRRSIDPAQVVEALGITGAEALPAEADASGTLRTRLANLGFPDGIALRMGVGYVPGAAQVMAQMEAANLEIQETLLTMNEIRNAFGNQQIQAALVSWTQPVERDGWVQRYGEDNVIALYTVPVSYLADADLPVSLTPGGFPVVIQANEGDALGTQDASTPDGS